MKSSPNFACAIWAYIQTVLDVNVRRFVLLWSYESGFINIRKKGEQI